MLIDERIDRGNSLIQFFTEHYLVVSNTLFKNHNRSICAWKEPGGKDKHQIDLYYGTLEVRKPDKQLQLRSRSMHIQ